MPLPESLILYERDDDGVPFAVEEVRAARWDPRFAVPPDAASADVRVVHLERGPLPRTIPSWLSVHLVTAGERGVAAGIAEDTPDYLVDGDRHARATPSLVSPRVLWPWSPHHRAPSAAIEEFIRAGAVALRYPDPPPVEPERQAEALRAFARGHDALRALITLRATALERWLHVAFREPERFATAILIARIETTAPLDAAAMRFLQEAHVPSGVTGLADLTVDRMVLLEQASPWRYLDHVPMTAALAAAQSWQRRYLRAYADHYRDAITERDRLLRDTPAVAARITTLERLNEIDALGEPNGLDAIEAARVATASLAAMSGGPDATTAITAGIRFGEPNARAHEFREATDTLERALMARLRRLSAALAACALEGDDDLLAIRNSIALSAVDHIDRVLDERLVARIQALLNASSRSPLARVAQQFPEVTLANLEAVVEEFRRAARQAIDLAPEGRASLRSGTAAPPLEY